MRVALWSSKRLTHRGLRFTSYPSLVLTECVSWVHLRRYCCFCCCYGYCCWAVVEFLQIVIFLYVSLYIFTYFHVYLHILGVFVYIFCCSYKVDRLIGGGRREFWYPRHHVASRSKLATNETNTGDHELLKDRFKDDFMALWQSIDFHRAFANRQPQLYGTVWGTYGNL